MRGNICLASQRHASSGLSSLVDPGTFLHGFCELQIHSRLVRTEETKDSLCPEVISLSIGRSYILWAVLSYILCAVACPLYAVGVTPVGDAKTFLVGKLAKNV